MLDQISLGYELVHVRSVEDWLGQVRPGNCN